MKITFALFPILITASLLLQGCTVHTKPAPVERKEHVFYGKNHKTTKVQQQDYRRDSTSSRELSDDNNASAPQDTNTTLPERDVQIQEETKQQEKADVYNEQSLTELEKELGTINIKPTSKSNFSHPHPLNSRAFTWPLEGQVLSRYGQAPSPFHEGIIITAPINSPVMATSAGEVVYVGSTVTDYGKFVIIKHANNIFSSYANNASVLVQKGDVVRQGQVIAKVGRTGGVQKPQLYFAIRKGRTTINPDAPL
ncbi:M23 family metallopeptidase [Rickettsiales endosymbiont of Peranema trichophorum]|uniref:murein hydrolase activator EnvC family protein n=1 Tax=Rickettsiales endosymbiont of Peranema trichophorum TaxID=2486577 RepID=UPI001023044D|nr:M23 family metallopeptidase [Rickettsiales endosymbiont of Peranema trichophorum]RZI47580.1 M23 family metallopeptidase [Rickettsiales endosymbiont of Peranema trichophorum]